MEEHFFCYNRRIYSGLYSDNILRLHILWCIKLSAFIIIFYFEYDSTFTITVVLVVTCRFHCCCSCCRCSGCIASLYVESSDTYSPSHIPNYEAKSFFLLFTYSFSCLLVLCIFKSKTFDKKHRETLRRTSWLWFQIFTS